MSTRTVRTARRAAAGSCLVALLAGVTAACTTEPVDPARAGTVVVSVDLPFRSLNGATPAGRAPGSVLVRGLVQSGFTTLAPDGTVSVDPSFGTVEKVADDPFTVRYTIAPTATWSDGVPVTPADLLLEWAARSGQLDEVVPEVGPDGTVRVPDDVVAFGAASPAAARATAVPKVDGATVTVVYDAPVADWLLALDVNLPAHVVGRLALDPDAPALPEPTPSDGGASPSPSGLPTAPADASASPSVDPSSSAAPTSSADASPSPDATSAPDATPSAGATGSPSPDASATPDASPEPTPGAADWAQAVATAVQQQDRDALVRISRVWRAAGRATDLRADPTLTTTTGPYVLAALDDDGVEAVRNEHYRGEAPAAFDRVRLRTDLDPLAQLEALDDDEVDVAAPVTTADVLAAAEALQDVELRTDGDAVLQLVLQEGAGGVFDPAAHDDADDPRAAAAAWRHAFLASVPRDRVVTEVVRPLWARADVSDVVAAQVGPAAPGASAAPGEPDVDGRRTVRVLTTTADPLRARVLELVSEAAADAGLDVVPVEADDPAQVLRTRPEDWDAALVPVVQDELPVAAFVARWRSGGATNVTGRADAELDEVLDALARQPDADAAADAVEDASRALREAGAVLPLVRTPALTVVAARDPERDAGLPEVTGVPVLTPAAADLTWWWNWTRR